MVGDARAFLAVVGPAGMSRSFRYEKFRTSHIVPGAGGVHVELDETPAGVFLELEGPRRAIDRMARRLGYRREEYITRSYAALHFEECRRRGVRAGDMVFGRRKEGRARGPAPTGSVRRAKKK
jgi:adenylate cyclase class IV